MVLLGTFMTDINLGIFTANLDPRNCIYATSEQLRIRHHHFHNVLLEDFIRELVRAKPKAAQRARCRRGHSRRLSKFVLRPDDTITIMRLMARLNESLDRPDGGDRRRGRRDVCRHGAGRARADGVHRAGVLHVDGFCRAGGAGGRRGTVRPARRWRWSATGRFR